LIIPYLLEILFLRIFSGILPKGRCSNLSLSAKIESDDRLVLEMNGQNAQ